MSDKMKINAVKIGTIVFLLAVVVTLFISLKKSEKADELATKVSSRFTAYDYLFENLNRAVIDSSGRRIGTVVILATKKQIDSFYSISGREKTKFYYYLIENSVDLNDLNDINE